MLNILIIVIALVFLKITLKNRINLFLHGETWPGKIKILEGDKIDLHTKIKGKYIPPGEVTRMITNPVVDGLLVLELDSSRFIIYKEVEGKGLIGSEIKESSKNWITCKNLLYLL